MIIYKVVSRMWHSVENKYYEPGETIDLSHLDGIGLAAVLASGAVEPVESEKKKKSVTLVQEGE